MEILNGRPNDIYGRAEKEIKAYDFLDSLGIEYQRLDHEPAMTMEACVEIDKVLGVAMCKNLFLCNRQQTEFYLLLMPADKQFKTKELSAQIGTARLSFASPEKMQELLGLTPGSATVLGLINDANNTVTLLLDNDILQQEYMGMHPCMNTSSIRVKTDDVIKRIIPVLGNNVIKVYL